MDQIYKYHSKDVVIVAIIVCTIWHAMTLFVAHFIWIFIPRVKDLTETSLSSQLSPRGGDFLRKDFWIKK